MEKNINFSHVDTDPLQSEGVEAASFRGYSVLADANCSRVCLWLSCVLLLASAGYELTGIGGIDAAGAIMIALFSFREGRESFEKARDGACHCDRCEK